MPTIEQIKKQVELIAPRYGLTRVSVFGSYAEGNPCKTSDIDLLITFPSREKLLKPVTLFTLSELKHDLQDALNKRVDLVESKNLKNSYLIIKKEIPVYVA